MCIVIDLIKAGPTGSVNCKLDLTKCYSEKIDK